MEPGATCGPSPTGLLGIAMICNPPADAGSDAEGGLDADSSGPDKPLRTDASSDTSDDTSLGDGAASEAGGDP